MEGRLTSSGRFSQEQLRWTQGKHVTIENFSGQIIFMSMFNDIVLDRKRNEDSCASTSRKIKEHASKFNDGHWNKDIQSIVMANGIFVLHKWWKISRIQDTQY